MIKKQDLVNGTLDREDVKKRQPVADINAYISETMIFLDSSVKAHKEASLSLSPRLRRRIVLVGLLVLVLCGILFASIRMRPDGFERPTKLSEKAVLAWEAAGNSTLGFHSIKFINLKKRFDRRDTAILQAYLSGIDLEDYPGVEQSMVDDQGMPPSSTLHLKVGEKGCWRAHANVWGDILQNRLPPVLIIESDATWDVNIRPAMATFNKYFTEFLRKTEAEPLYRSSPLSSSEKSPHFEASTSPLGHITRPSWKMNGPQRRDVQNDERTQGDHAMTQFTPIPLVEPDPDDPWHSEYWDLLSIGHCFDSQKRGNHPHLIYPDPYGPVAKTYFGHDLESERIIVESGGFACTTAYAVTQRGAAKLLLQMASDLYGPIDTVMKNMVSEGQLKAYSVNPAFFAQWVYMPGLGMNGRGSKSDIHGTSIEHVIEGEPPDMSGWDQARAAKTVWKVKPEHPDSALKSMALRVAWDYIFSKEKNITVGLYRQIS